MVIGRDVFVIITQNEWIFSRKVKRNILCGTILLMELRVYIFDQRTGDFAIIHFDGSFFSEPLDDRLTDKMISAAVYTRPQPVSWHEQNHPAIDNELWTRTLFPGMCVYAPIIYLFLRFLKILCINTEINTLFVCISAQFISKKVRKQIR